MNSQETQKCLRVIQGFQVGNFNVTSQGERYNLTIEKLGNEKILKFFARNLKTGEVVSGNFYKIGDEYKFRPCEISVERAYIFLSNVRI